MSNSESDSSDDDFHDARTSIRRDSEDRRSLDQRKKSQGKLQSPLAGSSGSLVGGVAGVAAGRDSSPADVEQRAKLLREQSDELTRQLGKMEMDAQVGGGGAGMPGTLPVRPAGMGLNLDAARPQPGGDGPPSTSSGGNSGSPDGSASPSPSPSGSAGPSRASWGQMFSQRGSLEVGDIDMLKRTSRHDPRLSRDSSHGRGSRGGSGGDSGDGAPLDAIAALRAKGMPMKSLHTNENINLDKIKESAARFLDPISQRCIDPDEVIGGGQLALAAAEELAPEDLERHLEEQRRKAEKKRAPKTLKSVAHWGRKRAMEAQKAAKEAAAEAATYAAEKAAETDLSSIGTDLRASVSGDGGGAAEEPEEVSNLPPGRKDVKAHRKPSREWNNTYFLQRLRGHQGAVWVLKFSSDGSVLASAGQDAVVRLWEVKKVTEDDPDGWTEGAGKGGEAARKTTADQVRSSMSEDDSKAAREEPAEGDAFEREGYLDDEGEESDPRRAVCGDVPFKELHGHEEDILDLSWSKNHFLLSSSMDKTVRLWHVSTADCLRIFDHKDFVPSVNFHPFDDKVFLSGCLDEKLRVWNIPAHRIVAVVDTGHAITASAFAPDGQLAIAGSYDGRVSFYRSVTSEAGGSILEYITELHLRPNKGHGRGRKITGITFRPGAEGDEILITSNDSRIRRYRLNDFSLLCKYHGLSNQVAQLSASFSDCGNFIVCGSEDQRTFIWNTEGESKRADRSHAHESFVAHSTVLTAAVFAPPFVRPPVIFVPRDAEVERIVKESRRLLRAGQKAKAQAMAGRGMQIAPGDEGLKNVLMQAIGGDAELEAVSAADGMVLITAGYTGSIKIFGCLTPI